MVVLRIASVAMICQTCQHKASRSMKSEERVYGKVKLNYPVDIDTGIKLYEWSSNLVASKLMLDHHLLDRIEKPTVETNEPETYRKENEAPIIEDWVSDSDEENVPKVNTVKETRVNTARPKAVISAVNGNKENVVKASTCWGNPQKDLKDKGVIDSGYSRHMTENRSCLTDYKEIDRGFVAFGGNSKGGKITRKGKIRTGKLDFEDVYFVKELKFNLFNVSQMCDKKNSVLFTDTECVVLSLDFKLTDESHVLLKVPRKDNMYSVDLRNVVPQGGLTCLFAKATPDESNLWHRRLGHVNFKTMNKLVRGNLVRGRKPALSFMRPFGYPVTILNTIDHLGKFDGKANEGFFIGYSTNSKAFRVFNSRTRIVEENLHVKLEWRQEEENKDVEDPRNEGGNPSEEGERVDQEKDPNVNSTNNINTVSPTVNAVGIEGNVVDENIVYGCADDPNMPDLEEIGKFSDVEDDVSGANINNLDTYFQVSLVPTTRIHKDHPLNQVIGDLIDAIRLFLAYVLFKDFVVYQMDVKSAFLYGKIEEEVYVSQPPGFEDPNFPDRVYNVDKALYGLHQAPRAWYETLSTYLLDNGFQRGKIDKTLFIRRVRRIILLVQVYVDDIIFGSTKKLLCIEFEKIMHKKFQMSSMGELTFFLGLQVKQKNDGIFISQDKYVTEILNKFGFSDVKTASTPMETHKPLLKDADGEDIDEHMYRSMIGSMMYLTSSRPDIMFVVCVCVRFQVNPKVSHLHAVKRIFRYLKGQPKVGLWLISWQCKKQNVVDNSTTKAEYIAASNCVNVVYDTPSHTKKIFANMRRKGKDFSGTVTPLFSSMLAQQADMGEGSRHPTDPQHTSTSAQPSNEKQITAPSSSQPKKTYKRRKPKKVTEIPQSSEPTNLVADEVVHEERGDIMEKAATTATSLDVEKDSGNINRTQSTTMPNVALPQGIGSGGRPRRQETLGDRLDQTRIKLKELMEICTKLSERVIDLETTKTAQAKEIANLKKRVKKLEKKRKSRTLEMNLFKIGTSRRRSLGEEDASKQGRNLKQGKQSSIFEDSDFDEEFDANMDEAIEQVYDANKDTVEEGEVQVPTADMEVNNEVVTTAKPSTPPTTTTITTVIKDEDLIIAQTLMKMKSKKSKVRGVTMQEPNETATRPTVPPPQHDPKDKGKAKMVEPKKPLKRKAQIKFDGEDDVQALMDADYELAARLQVEEQGELSVEEKSRLFVELMDKSKKHFAKLRAKEQRRKPPTKAQKRNQMYSFVPMDSEVVKGNKDKAEGNKKRTREELDEDSVKRQKMEDDAEKAELKLCLEIVPYDNKVVNFEPLATKSPIVDWKTQILGEDIYYQGRIIGIKRLLSAVEVTAAGYGFYCWSYDEVPPKSNNDMPLRHFKTLSLDELRSHDFNLFSDKEYSKEEVAEIMAETMEQYMSKTRADYGSGVASPKIKDKDNFELKGQFLKELRTNTFSGSNHEDANEHIEKLLEIIDLFHIPNITIDQVMLRAFPMSLTRAASHWLRNEPTGSITTWDGLKKISKQILSTCSNCKEDGGNQQLSAST
ncbi:putative ribonuclease H-like domain-containing protein [Tanacetum coccineum]